MIWGPFALAVVLGTIVAAAVYTAYRWPEHAPVDDTAERLDEAAPTPPAADPSAGANAGA